MNAALADGLDAAEHNFRNRVLKDHAQDIHINRCGQCNRIVRTPKARQCFWCGYDWHPKP
ncbi:hypothetical protein JGU66_04800 [Myxococcaceae bacterium JPH2]|nr:hypothetical protein [Myxococcaceae bacterium JPH2]